MTHSWIFTVQYSLLLVKMLPLDGMYDELVMASEWSGKIDFGCRELLPPTPHFSFHEFAFFLYACF